MLQPWQIMTRTTKRNVKIYSRQKMEQLAWLCINRQLAGELRSFILGFLNLSSLYGSALATGVICWQKCRLSNLLTISCLPLGVSQEKCRLKTHALGFLQQVFKLSYCYCFLIVVYPCQVDKCTWGFYLSYLWSRGTATSLLSPCCSQRKHLCKFQLVLLFSFSFSLDEKIDSNLS